MIFKRPWIPKKFMLCPFPYSCHRIQNKITVKYKMGIKSLMKFSLSLDEYLDPCFKTASASFMCEPRLCRHPGTSLGYQILPSLPSLQFEGTCRKHWWIRQRSLLTSHLPVDRGTESGFWVPPIRSFYSGRRYPRSTLAQLAP